MMLTNSEVKNELLDILVKLDKIFKENMLEYSIMSGTLLGAVRHGGFIPWDDDIDIAMRREEYDRFLTLIKNGLLESYGLAATGYEVNKDFWPFLKVINPQIGVEQDQDGQATQCDYLWIDVFPFDYLPETKSKETLREIAYQRKLLGYKIAQEKEFYKHKNGIKKVTYYILAEIFKFVSVDRINEKIISLSKSNAEKTTLMGDLTWGRAGADKCVPASLFDELVEYTFEDVAVKGFKDYDSYLKQIFGDYMKLPPENQRVNHGIKAWRITKNEE